MDYSVLSNQNNLLRRIKDFILCKNQQISTADASQLLTHELEEFKTISAEREIKRVKDEKLPPLKVIQTVIIVFKE